MNDLLQQIDPARLKIALPGILLLLTVTLFFYALWPMIKGYQSSVETRDQLNRIVSNGGQLKTELDSVGKQIQALNHHLHGDMAGLPPRQMESYIIGRLQKISWDHHIELVSVKPKQGQTVQIFREMLFDVEINGGYYDFFDWLQTLGNELGFVVIKAYQMALLDQKSAISRLRVKLTMASYRVEE